MTGEPEPVDRDPGLQPERTRLAWRRSTLAHAVVVLLVVRLALTRGTTGALAAAAALAGWTLLVGVTYRRMVGPHGPGPRARRPAGKNAIPSDGLTAAARPGGSALSVSAAVTIGYAVLGTVLLLTR